MLEQQPTFELLFEQLGLDATEPAMTQFIKDHQLDAETSVYDASFWNEGQRQFLKSHLGLDDDWAIVIDELNRQLHIDSMPE